MTITPSSAAKQARLALGARMREIRRDAHLSGRSLADATGQHFTRISKFEHGVQVPDEGDIRAWCRACGADDQVPDLIATARAVESAYLEFRRQARAGMKRVTGAHTVALYVAVAARMDRQKVVFDRGKRFRVVLEEQALRTWFGTAEVQAGQLGRLLELMSVPTVSLGIEVTRPDEIGLCDRMFRHLETSAAHGAAARRLIVRAHRELQPAQ